VRNVRVLSACPVERHREQPGADVRLGEAQCAAVRIEDVGVVETPWINDHLVRDPRDVPHAVAAVARIGPARGEDARRERPRHDDRKDAGGDGDEGGFDRAGAPGRTKARLWIGAGAVATPITITAGSYAERSIFQAGERRLIELPMRPGTPLIRGSEPNRGSGRRRSIRAAPTNACSGRGSSRPTPSRAGNSTGGPGGPP